MLDSLDPLPSHVRARLNNLLARLPATLRLHSLRQTAGGWTATLHDSSPTSADGNFGVEIVLFDEPTTANDSPPMLPRPTRPPAA